MDRRQTIQQWYIQYNQDIYQYLVYYTGKIEVEDLVQETFIRAIKAYESYQAKSSPKTWLFSIARRIAIDAYRKQKVLTFLPEVFQIKLASQGPSPSELLEADEELEEIYRAISMLKSSYREVFIFRAIKEFSVSETATILNWSEAKVNTTYHRSCKALRHHLDQRGVSILDRA